jgi:hypothetical protein
MGLLSATAPPAARVTPARKPAKIFALTVVMAQGQCNREARGKFRENRREFAVVETE